MLINLISTDEHPGVPSCAAFYLKKLLHHVTTQILVTSLRRICCNHYCIGLCPTDRTTLMDISWPELFILNASGWPQDVAAMAKVVISPNETSSSSQVNMMKHIHYYNANRVLTRADTSHACSSVFDCD